MKTGKTILVLLPLDSQNKEKLEEMAPDCHFLYPKRNELTKELIHSAHVILGHVPVPDLEGSQTLEWMQIEMAGATRYVTDAFPKQAVLTNASGAYGLAISEHMLGLLLMIKKRLYQYRDNQNKRLWHGEGTVTAIEGSTTLVIGLGDIGGSFASRMKALGSRTIGIKRHLSAKPDYLDELHLADDLDSLLPHADVVALSLPETPETRHLMNRERLSAMKKTAVLLNVGRGNAIDTEALCDLMESGHLLGAGLDVTDPEPLPSSHRLWKIKNAVITPHISGGYNLPQTRQRINQIVLENFARYLNDQPLINVVDFKTGYRKFKQDQEVTR